MSDKIQMRDTDTMMVMCKDARIIHFPPNMSLPHVEFGRRITRELPEGAWVGTVSKLNGQIAPNPIGRVSNGIEPASNGIGFHFSPAVSAATISLDDDKQNCCRVGGQAYFRRLESGMVAQG